MKGIQRLGALLNYDEDNTNNNGNIKRDKREERDIYFIIVYNRKQKEKKKDFIFSNNYFILPSMILNKEIIENKNKYVYIKVFKYRIYGTKKKVELIFYIGKEDEYIITLDVGKKTFIYEVDLKKCNKYIDNVPKENINRKVIDYEDEFNLFLEALKQNKEEEKNKELYKETIELYSRNNSFILLISLFTKIYQEKDLCCLLLQKFYDININCKDLEKKDSISDKKEKLEKLNSLMAKIASESEKLIKENDYNPIHFYGIIICYLNNYDYITYENLINQLYDIDKEILFEILLVYFSQFFNPLKKDEKDKYFFINFIEYVISKKEFFFFKIGLKFIGDIDTFIIVIDKTKEILYNKYIKENNKTNFEPIELADILKLKKENIYDIIEGISSINKYSSEIKILLVYFKSDFWKSLLKEFSELNPEYFRICLKLRKIFLEYFEIIKSLFELDQEKEKDKYILNDIENYVKID